MDAILVFKGPIFSPVLLFDEASIEVHYVSSRAVVGGQSNFGSAKTKILVHTVWEIHKVLHRRAPETVKGLIIVTYHTNVPLPSQSKIELFLNVIGVLILIHDYVLKDILCIRISFYQLQGLFLYQGQIAVFGPLVCKQIKIFFV